MERAILKTLIYADIFDYPLKAWEIQKWLIGRSSGLREIERGLKKLINKKRVGERKGYYFLKNRENLVSKRLKREKVSRGFLEQARWIAQSFRIIPWIKLVGVSGGLAMRNCEKSDDIDFFIITDKGRVWISRLFVLGLLSVMGKRRKRGEKGKQIAKKVCTNLILDTDNLSHFNNNIYIAHEVLQMQVLWEKDNVYTRYLEANEWAFKYLPNWIASEKRQKERLNDGLMNPFFDRLINMLEWAARKIQIKIMGKIKGKEKIANGALFFHPEDYSEKILGAFKKKIRSI